MFKTEDLQTAVKIRQDIHQHPELRYEEHRTAALVAKRLRTLGFEVQTGIAQTGVIGLLETGRAGPVIALRADMDALPIIEATALPYQSVYPGKMHACGHDGHTASLLLAAAWLAQNRDRLRGTIKLLFQPAEEGGNGAALMVAEGALAHPTVDAIFGYHNRPGHKAGLLLLRAGPTMGGNDTYHVTIHGVSGHAAMPHLAVDPIYIAANIIQQTQGIVGRLKSPLQSGLITVSAVHAGVADNAIPGEAKLTLNIRSDCAATRAQLIDQLETLLHGCCTPFGGSYSLSHVNTMPPLVNPPAAVAAVQAAVQQYLPTQEILLLEAMPTMGSEDFAYYLEEVTGCYFFIGNGETGPYVHNHGYDYNDDILPAAAGVFVAIVQHYCAR
ncbi:MAG: amidohydrolase [Neisseriaceae bacterium]|nr:amidohydrolase [Neisseriaceae bacterium]